LSEIEQFFFCSACAATAEPLSPVVVQQQEENVAQLIKLARALEEFDALKERGDMTVSLARTFLAVAAEEGLTGKDLEQRLSMSQGSISRHLLDLSQRNRRMEPGLDLIEWRLAERDFRVKHWFLTSAGKKLRSKLQGVH
jgi:DNA-binding MarR family transcriptional regulator